MISYLQATGSITDVGSGIVQHRDTRAIERPALPTIVRLPVAFIPTGTFCLLFYKAWLNITKYPEYMTKAVQEDWCPELIEDKPYFQHESETPLFAVNDSD